MIDNGIMDIIHKNYIEISIVASSPRGLIVPVLKDV